MLPELKVAIFNGEYTGDTGSLAHICDIEGSVVPDGRPPFSVLEEVALLLEMCAAKYGTPCPVGECFTVFIGRKIDTDITSLARLDVIARDGRASASFIQEGVPRVDTEATAYNPDDDVVTIVVKVLESLSASLALCPFDMQHQFLQTRNDLALSDPNAQRRPKTWLTKSHR